MCSTAWLERWRGEAKISNSWNVKTDMMRMMRMMMFWSLVDLGSVLLASGMDSWRWSTDELLKWAESVGQGAGLVHMFIFLRYAVMSNTSGLIFPPWASFTPLAMIIAERKRERDRNKYHRSNLPPESKEI